jgi:glycosyltransferase involved in cell wall biosynthesis
MNSVRSAVRILMLATDAHGGFGGISQYNRDILTALSECEGVAEVVVLPRIVIDTDFSAPAKVHYDLRGARGSINFIMRSMVQALIRGPFDVVYCAHINLLPIASLIGRLCRVPVVLTIYGIDAWNGPVGWRARLNISHADLVISISQITLDRFRRWFGDETVRTAILPNAIRLEEYGTGEKNAKLSERLGLSGKRILMTLGRMSAQERYKGFDQIIEVLPKLRLDHPDIVYLAVGDGDDRPRLQAKAREYGVSEAVVFTGRIPECNKAEYYRLADAYVMPSSGEGFGFVVIEALACGIPVVASMADGTREAVRGGELGVLVDPADPRSLEEGIQKALKQTKRQLPGIEYFSHEKFAKRLENALQQLVPM